MAIVRELTTILDFKVDKSGFTQAEAAVNQIKSSVIALGKIFGIVFAAEKLFEYVDELKNAGKEVAKLTYQLNRMARPGDDIAAAQKQLFQIAQDTGMEYTKTLDVFREFLNESKELNISQDQIVATIDNMYKGLRLGAATSEEINQTFEALNRAFRLGRIGMRQFGLLVDIAPEVMNALAESLGKTRAQLEEMAKDGKLTSDVFLKALGTRNQKLMEDFSKRARKLGEGFTYAWNEAVILSYNIFKLVNSGGAVANMIVYLTDKIKVLLTTVNDFFGGLDKSLRMLAILIGVVIAKSFVTSVILAISWTRRWTNAINLLKLALKGIVIFGLTEGIEDLIVWMQGGESVIGDFLGKYEDVMKFLKNQFNTNDMFAGFQAILKFFQGDTSGALEELNKSFKSWWGILVDIGIALTAIAVFEFFGLISVIANVSSKFVGLLTIVKNIGAALIALDTITLAGLIGVLTKIVPLAGMIAAALYGKEFAQSMMDLALGRPSGTTQQRAESIQSGGGTSLWNFIKGLGNSALNTGQSLITPSQITPGGSIVTPTGVSVVPNNIINQSNEIEIKIDPAFQLGDLIKNAIEDVMAKWTRDARNANPLIEQPSR